MKPTAALIGVVLVTYTGHLGGSMVHPDRSKFQGGFPGGGFGAQGNGGSNAGSGGQTGQPGGGHS